jgi:hypothetical protein
MTNLGKFQSSKDSKSPPKNERNMCATYSGSKRIWKNWRYHFYVLPSKRSHHQQHLNGHVQFSGFDVWFRVKQRWPVVAGSRWVYTTEKAPAVAYIVYRSYDSSMYFIYLYLITLVGGWPTPLKNMSS